MPPTVRGTGLNPIPIRIDQIDRSKIHALRPRSSRCDVSLRARPPADTLSETQGNAAGRFSAPGHRTLDTIRDGQPGIRDGLYGRRVSPAAGPVPVDVR